ncbi:MAG TPA: cytochrome b N-terminal domain-containing protein [Pyrinomonadaceae bacterium]|nr:cytochrome b N-terminal domain-containing protein [Pyrinomonadaceae bacterium]
MAAELETKFSFGSWISNTTEIGEIKNRLLDEPSEGFSAWMRTTAGIIAFLFFVQFLTGVLMAFYYVPTIENSYITVAYIEQGINAGNWIRSLHYHSSVLLPLVLVIHLAQMIFRNALTRIPLAWAFSLVFLTLVLAAGATGYALPWDARAINGVNIAVSLAGNTPLIGKTLQMWLQNGNSITTLTLSRFYALHVFVVPTLILACIIARLFIFGKRKDVSNLENYSIWAKKQFVRNAVSIGLVFLALALFSVKYAAPFGPTAADSGNYLPRPGPQFLWLFEMQKYTEGNLAAILAFGFPALIIGGLFILPLLNQKIFSKQRLAATVFFIIGFGAVGSLTATAYFQDSSDARISEQLAKQEKEEAEFRASAFKPKVIHLGKEPEKSEKSTNVSTSTESPNNSENTAVVAVPKVYTANCAKCHGGNGEGTAKFPELVGVTTREEDALTDEAVVGIINDPKAFGLSAKMPAYKDKLNDEEKQAIVAWIKSLKPSEKVQ